MLREQEEFQWGSFSLNVWHGGGGIEKCCIYSCCFHHENNHTTAASYLCIIQRARPDFPSYSGGISGLILTQLHIFISFLGGRQLGDNRGAENWSEQRPEA